MKISHEVPFCLLEKSREFNDYDYCLPHLLDQNEEYKNFFYESKKMGRYIVMDNSLHELGEAYDTDRLLYWVNELEPNEFIIPDVWEDYESSVENAIKWKDIELPDYTTKVVVVQGKTLGDAEDCFYDYVGLGYEKIAFSYGAAWYNDVCPHPNKDLGKAIGRFNFISSLYQNEWIPHYLRIHLLGTASPIEFGMYSNMPNIESIDTSNPIMAAIGEIPYHNLGLNSKPKANMNECQDIDIKSINIDLVEYNVEQFRKINNLNKIKVDMSESKYVSLYEYLGHAAGGELGQKVAYEAAKAGIQPETREVSNSSYTGIVYTYPELFLESYFNPPTYNPQKSEPQRPEPKDDGLPF